MRKHCYIVIFLRVCFDGQFHWFKKQTKKYHIDKWIKKIFFYPLNQTSSDDSFFCFWHCGQLGHNTSHIMKIIEWIQDSLWISILSKAFLQLMKQNPLTHGTCVKENYSIFYRSMDYPFDVLKKCLVIWDSMILLV